MATHTASLRRNHMEASPLSRSLPAWLVVFLLTLVWSQRSYLYFLIPQKVYATAGTATFGGTGGTGGNSYGNIFYDHDNTSYLLDPNATGTSLAVAGSVGIGDTTPDARLSVNSTTTGLRANTWVDVNSSACGLAGIGQNVYLNQADNTYKAANTHTAVGGSLIQLGTCSYPAYNDIAFLRATGTTGSISTTADTTIAMTESMRITSAGNVGIGTTAPTVALDVTGSINFSTKLLEDGNEIFANMIAPFASACPTGWTAYTAAQGRYIVGTPSSGTNAGTIGSAMTNQQDLTHTHTGPSHQHNVPLAHPAGGANNHYGFGDYPYGAGSPNIYLYAEGYGDGGESAAPMLTSASGTGSTGTASTSSIAPYIQLTMCQKTAGADLAEWISGSTDLSQATIVSVDPQNNQKVVVSDKPYDPTVVGIVSTSPGWLIGSEKPGKIQMALAGRVPVRVSLVNGDIKRGDSITTSSIPGVGMKATQAGSIIGKTLDVLNENSPLVGCTNPATGSTEKCGEIVVFVNPSWYDPDVYLTSTGDLNITAQPDGSYVLQDKTGSLTTRIGAFAELIVAKIQAGIIETKRLIVDGVDILKELKELKNTVAAQQQQIDALKAEVEALKK